MHKIDGPGATASNEFQFGNPVIGVQSTIVTAGWLNSLQAELERVILAANIVLLTSATDTQDQLLAAIQTHAQDGPAGFITLLSPRALAIGDGFVVGAAFGVALQAVGSSESVLAKTTGLHRLTKNSADSWTAGDPIYWDDSGPEARAADASGRKLIGSAAEDRIATTTDALIRVSGLPDPVTP